jgi:hypothetical protein
VNKRQYRGRFAGDHHRGRVDGSICGDVRVRQHAELGKYGFGFDLSCGFGSIFDAASCETLLRGGLGDVRRVLPERELNDPENQKQEERSRDDEFRGRRTAFIPPISIARACGHRLVALRSGIDAMGFGDHLGANNPDRCDGHGNQQRDDNDCLGRVPSLGILTRTCQPLAEAADHVDHDGHFREHGPLLLMVGCRNS